MERTERNCEIDPSKRIFTITRNIFYKNNLITSNSKVDFSVDFFYLFL